MDHLDDRWLYIRSCNDAKFYPSKKSIQKWDKPHLDITEIKHEPEPIGGHHYDSK